MNDFKFVSERYDVKNTSKYRLSIQVNKDGFSVLIKDEKREVLQLWHIPGQNIENSVQQLYEHEELDSIRRLNFATNQIILNTSGYSLLPEELFEEKKERFILENSVQLEEKDVVNYDFIPEINARVLYKIDSHHQSFIKLFKNNPRVKHISTSLLKAFSPSGEETSCYSIYDAGENIHLLAFKDNQLVFINSFSVKDINEIVYYCLSSFKKLNLPSPVKVYYSGQLSPDEKAFLHLKKYFPGMEIMQNPLPFEIAGRFNESYFINLLQ